MTGNADRLDGVSVDDLILRGRAVDDDEADPAVIELGRLGGPREVDLGIRWLGDPSPVLRSRGAILLSQFGEVALAAAARLPDASLLRGLRSWLAGTGGPGSFWSDPLDVGEPDPELTELIDRIMQLG